MGAKAEQLARVDGWDDSVVYTTDSGLSTRQTEADETVRQLRAAAPDLGLYGASADAAYERFWELSSRVAAVSLRIDGLRTAGMAALAAVQRAQEGYATLPETALSSQDHATIRQQCRPDMFGQTIPTFTAELQLRQQKEAAREAAATRVLGELSAEMTGIVVPEAEYYDPSTDPNAQTGEAPRSHGTSSQGGRSVGGYSTGGYSTGAAYTAGGAAVVAAAAPALITTFPGTAGGGSSTGVIGGGSSSGGKGGSGAGSGTNPGTVYTPGHGDGSSSDGSTVGTVPVGGSAGGGGGWGGSSGTGSTLGGVGAGGLAGGLMVGGAALGAGKLGGGARSGGGMLGVGGLGSAGGLGGGAGTIGGAGGAGTTSMIGGTTSSLAQGSQTGATGTGASGSRAGTTGGMPMGGGSGGAGGQSKDKRRGSLGLLAPDLGVTEDGATHDLGAGALAGGRDSLPAGPTTADEADEDTW